MCREPSTVASIEGSEGKAREGKAREGKGRPGMARFIGSSTYAINQGNLAGKGFNLTPL